MKLRYTFYSSLSPSEVLRIIDMLPPINLSSLATEKNICSHIRGYRFRLECFHSSISRRAFFHGKVIEKSSATIITGYFGATIKDMLILFSFPVVLELLWGTNISLLLFTLFSFFVVYFFQRAVLSTKSKSNDAILKFITYNLSAKEL